MGNLKKAQDLALEAEKFNKEFSGHSFQGKDLRGFVSATFNGLAEPTGIEFTDEALHLSPAELSAAAMQALTQGHSKSKKAAMDRLRAVMTPMSGSSRGPEAPDNDSEDNDE